MTRSEHHESGFAPAVLGHSTGFHVGGVGVSMTGSRESDVALGSSLKDFRSLAADTDIQIEVRWVDRLSPATGPRIFDSGSVWQLYEWGSDFQFDFSTPVLGDHPYKRFRVNHNFTRGTLELSKEAFADYPHPVDPLEYPLDELLIMHRLTQESAIELHSCGVVLPDGTGCLFVGHSGAGKSTTTRLWIARQNVTVLSDDRIIVRRESLQRKMRMYGTPWHGEARHALPASARLERIFILEHGTGNIVTRLSASEAIAELFARSFVPFHNHQYVESALQFLQEVADSVPCYRYAFEPNPSAVERILQLRD